MCLFRRFALILILGVAVCSTEVSAQDLIGTSGLINIPTADMQPDGTFDGGARWMSPAALHDLVNYDTGLYYVRFTPFSFFEFTFRETLFKTQHSVKKTWNYYQQDRSSTIRVRPLVEREGKWWPSVVIGVNDIYSAYGASFYTGYYGVATKHFQLGDGKSHSLPATSDRSSSGKCTMAPLAALNTSLYSEFLCESWPITIRKASISASATPYFGTFARLPSPTA